MKFSKLSALKLGLALALAAAQPAQATNFSFIGNFTHDNDVQLFSFSIGATTSVYAQTYSFAGGTNAAGSSIAAGGFVPVLGLFAGDGTHLNNSQAASSCGLNGNPSAADPASGACWDTFFDLPSLPVGNYFITLTQFDNTAIGPNLLDGFVYGSGINDFNGTPFLATALGLISGSGAERDGHWALDIKFVDYAVPMPAPTTLSLAFAGLAALAPFARRRRH